jgi:hypothetical protein
MHTIYIKIAAKVKIRILTNWDQKEFFFGKNLCYWSYPGAAFWVEVDRSNIKSIDRNCSRSIESLKLCRNRNRNKNRTETSSSSFLLEQNETNLG